MGVNVHQEDGYYCLLNIVAVGGGGGPAGGDGGYGGGGSGLVLHRAIHMLGGEGNDELEVKVGSGGNYGKAGKDTTIDWGLTPAYQG